MKYFPRLLAILLPFATIAGEPDPSFERPGALLLNVTEADLNRIVRSSFHSKGGPNFEGTKRRSSATVSGLTYQAKLSEPLIELSDGGRLALKFDVEEGNLHIARLERKFAGRSASCEDTNVFVDPSRPLEVMLALDLRIEDGSLRIVPDNVTVNDAEGRLNLVKPARCTNALLPRWLLWWLGKPTLKRYLGDLDEMLLARARKSATRIEETRDLLHKSWELDGGSAVHLYPTSLDTGHGSLFVSLTASSAPPHPGSSLATAQHGLPSDRSYIALSESFMNDLARHAISRMSAERIRPTGNLRKLLRSSSVYALIPGLRGLEPSDTLLYSVAVRTVPQIEITTSSGGDAMIRLRLSDIELRLFKGDEHGPTPLGTLAVKSGRIAVVPYRGILGGISFRIVENEWAVASKGIRVDDALVAATLQEVTFGRIFETTYQPLAAHWHVGETGFVPLAFDAAGGYLVIGMGEPPTELEERAAQAPMRTSILPASH